MPLSRSAISEASVSRTSPSDPDSPSTVALVESPTSASTPASPACPQRGLVQGIAHQRVGVDLPVAGVHDTPIGRLDQQRVGLRDRMSEGDEGEREGPQLQAARERHLGQRHLRQKTRVLQFLAQDRRGERGRIHGAAEPGPQVGHRAQMVLVRMGQHDGEEVFPAFLDERRVRHDHVDAGQRVAGEGNAEIDHQPRALTGIEVEVHADLPRPAEGQEVQRVALDAGRWQAAEGAFIGPPGCGGALRANPRMVMSGSTASMADVASPKSPASPPVATVVTGTHRSRPSCAPRYPRSAPHSPNRCRTAWPAPSPGQSPSPVA